uniref:programmed cell death protein 4 isoform X1 n=2 Tax=Myxine glutinosa TaxID=7769 RepID=UPI00358F7255
MDGRPNTAPAEQGEMVSQSMVAPAEEFSDDLNGNWSSEDKTLNEARIRAREKRRLRKSSSRDSGRESLSDANGDTKNGSASPSKPGYDRRSRSGKGRGLPKKGGAGGKGVWGAPGQVYDDEENVDTRDPNYDDDQGDCFYETVVPELDGETLEKSVAPIVKEYFEHGDTKEVLLQLQDLNLGKHEPELSVLAVSLSLEGRASHRELTSRLLSDLCHRALSKRQLATAFDKLLGNLGELLLDTPDASQMLGQFVARAMADDILPADFLESHKGRVACVHARAALDRASVLLGIKRSIMKLDNVWGVGGGQRPVKHLIKEMNLLLKEYLASEDVAEAEHCLKDLEVPHFYHELVYEAVVMVLESSKETTLQMMVKLLKAFWDSGVLTIDQMNRGFERVFASMDDLILDVPLAHSILEHFMDNCLKEGVISKQLHCQCPSRGRKRMVSEGDGGQLKPC